MSKKENEFLNKFSLKGKVALVTGGTRGLGKAMAEGLAMAGADIAVVSTSGNDSEIKKVVTSLRRRYYHLALDLTQQKERSQLIPEVVRHFGRLDILVNNAGICPRYPAIDFPLDVWNKTIELLLITVFELSQAAAKVMIPQGSGKIINIASLASFQGGWAISGYTAAKHGVAGLTKSLANEWASRNINVNAIAPGYFETDLTAPLKKNSKRNQEIVSRIPAGHWGDPKDLIGSVIFLASEASNYVNGHVLVVDGGWMGR